MWSDWDILISLSIWSDCTSHIKLIIKWLHLKITIMWCDLVNKTHDIDSVICEFNLHHDYSMKYSLCAENILLYLDHNLDSNHWVFFFLLFQIIWELNRWISKKTSQSSLFLKLYISLKLGQMSSLTEWLAELNDWLNCMTGS